jgi:hypothetical protein
MVLINIKIRNGDAKMIRKYFVLLIVAALIGSIFGCAQESTKQNKSSSTESSANSNDNHISSATDSTAVETETPTTVPETTEEVIIDCTNANNTDNTCIPRCGGNDVVKSCIAIYRPSETETNQFGDSYKRNFSSFMTLGYIDTPFHQGSASLYGSTIQNIKNTDILYFCNFNNRDFKRTSAYKDVIDANNNFDHSQMIRLLLGKAVNLTVFDDRKRVIVSCQEIPKEQFGKIGSIVYYMGECIKADKSDCDIRELLFALDN